MASAVFLMFLSRLPQGTTGKVFLIVDRLRIHQWAKVSRWATAHGDRIELFYLPRYAPELNPDGYPNNDLKPDVNAKGLPRDKAEYYIKLIPLGTVVLSPA